MKLLNSGQNIELEDGDHLWVRRKGETEWGLASVKDGCIYTAAGDGPWKISDQNLDDYDFVEIFPPKN